MRVWLFESPTGAVTRKSRLQIAVFLTIPEAVRDTRIVTRLRQFLGDVNLTGVSKLVVPDNVNDETPGIDPTLLRLRQFLGDVTLSGTSKLVQSEEI